MENISIDKIPVVALTFSFRPQIFVWGGGGLVVCRWGELGLGRRRRNRGGEGR